MTSSRKPTIGEQVARLDMLEIQRANVLIYCNEIARQAAEPPSVPPPPWVVRIRELLDAPDGQPPAMIGGH